MSFHVFSAEGVLIHICPGTFRVYTPKELKSLTLSLKNFIELAGGALAEKGVYTLEGAKPTHSFLSKGGGDTMIQAPSQV